MSGRRRAPSIHAAIGPRACTAARASARSVADAVRASGRARHARTHVAATRRGAIDLLPALPAQHLERTEARLVAHLGMSIDPVAEVDVGQSLAPRQRHLAAGSRRCPARAPPRRARRTCRPRTGPRASRRSPRPRPGGRRRGSTRKRVGLQGQTRKRLEVLGIGVVHATAGMPLLQVALVERRRPPSLAAAGSRLTSRSALRARQRRWLRSGTKDATAMREGVQARQRGQAGR